MERIIPDACFDGLPCLYVAVGCAIGRMPGAIIDGLKPDGYATLSVANKFIRSQLSVKRRKDYKRGERAALSRLFGPYSKYEPSTKAIVCVLGHYVYVDGQRYYSFFDNDDDDVVAVWELNG